VQVPAFEFPVEQHFLLPFVHWFADPIQIKLLAALHGEFKKRSFHDQQMSVQHVRPLTRGSSAASFPEPRSSRSGSSFRSPISRHGNDPATSRLV
jgi:hypothetical protein